MSSKVVAIVQARMGSSRLPGKVLMEFNKKPVIWHIHNRLSSCNNLDQIVIATSSSKKDKVLYNYCLENGFSVYRGDENDVLNRYVQASKNYKADVVVRITGDCPVIDPDLVDEVIAYYFDGGYDACGLSGEFPDGLDCEIFSVGTLEDACKNANLKSEREHVGPYIYKNKNKYKIGSYVKYKGLKNHRWTLDELEDYHFLNEIYRRLYNPDSIFKTEDILRLLSENPELMNINKSIIRNEGYQMSVKNDGPIDPNLNHE